MRAACLQMTVQLCDKESNIATALNLLDRARNRGAELIVLPEVFSTGFCYDHIDDLAEQQPYPTLERLATDVGDSVVIGSIIERRDGRFYNLGFCLDDGELVGIYRKTHPFGRENEYFTPGDELAVFDTSLGRIGLAICYEVRFPEVYRRLTLEGADLLVTIGEFPESREHHWRSLAVARAIENLCPHVACNCLGKDDVAEYRGASLILDAWGETIADAGSAEGIIMGEVSLAQRDRARGAIPALKDRRPDLY